MKESIQPFINKRMLVLNESTPAKVAARALYERQVGSAVVSDHHGHIVGLVTDRDLACQVLGFDLSGMTPISEIMTEDILTVNKGASISDVAKKMEENGIRRIPVVEKNEKGRDRCVGMVSLDDLIASESLNVRLLSSIVKTQMVRGHLSFRSSYKDENHKEQTLNKFNKAIANQMNLPKAMAEQIAFYLLKELVRRLPYTEAAHFIAQLPSLIHEDLLNLPAGPNFNVNEETVVENLVKSFQLDHAEAFAAIKGFWTGLEHAMDSIILDHVLDRLPEEMRALFSNKKIDEEVLLAEYVINQDKFKFEGLR